VAAGRSCFTLSDSGAQTAIAGTSAAELTAGIGHYFRELCNMTFGWPRGGGSNVFTPAACARGACFLILGPVSSARRGA
jgi:hypothetical protein